MNRAGQAIVKKQILKNQINKTRKKEKQSGERETISCCRVQYHSLQNGPNSEDYTLH